MHDRTTWTLSAGSQLFAVPATGRLLVGRNNDAGIVLDSPSVSRTHAHVWVEENELRVEDLGSQNGVFVNGDRIAGPRALAPGDRLGIGDRILVVRRPGRDDEPTSPALPHRLSEAQARRTTAPVVVAMPVLLGQATFALEREQLGLAGLALERSCALLEASAPGSIDEASVDALTAAILDMARASGSAAWIEHLLRTRRLARRPLDARTLDAVARILSELPQYRQRDRRAYVLWRSSPDLGAAERRALERLENAAPR